MHLCSLLESKIADQLPNWYEPAKGKHRILALVAPDGVTTLQRLSKESGAFCQVYGNETRKSGKGIRELSWNHTTLHMRAIDPSWTYLQMLLPQQELEVIDALKLRWGDDLLWHLEAVRQLGVQRLAALPIVRWRDKNSLNELMNHCRDLGVVLFNPHAITVEDGGLGIIDCDQVEAKRTYDPKGILNPGKLKGWK